ncbi:MAG: RidA family protein [Alphaproteobacteria bacterium]|jgi:enamine deaminase RidA (YjgF/YER057c/UK114 family)|nr:RidA family protein [Rhodospirillaceae bacterium]MBT6205412.1 RidA family protein [Rhodospirillaceae bacterium]MBT6509456.1 RidA family protein [Rhodospirillaceae bacterium]MBT7647117.1 RidA family protein [Rhodospirillaceae bacterium]MDG2482545.1 RidA family protein [Alphaproteobacteria bacterium]
MAGVIEARLAELGIDLPEAAAPAANYVPYVVSGNHVFVAGQITLHNGELKYQGKLGQEFSVDEGYQAARLCALNIIAQVKAACGGDLDRVVRIVRLGGFVNADGNFHDHPKVINGASDLMVEVFGDKGRHARAAVGCPALPLNVATEVDAIVEIA